MSAISADTSVPTLQRNACSLPGGIALAEQVPFESVAGYDAMCFAARRDPTRRVPAGVDRSPPQPSGGTLVEQFGLTEVFCTARMYTGGAAGNDTIRVFGVTSLELG